MTGTPQDQAQEPPALSGVLTAVGKFESDLGFTAPELTGMRISELRSAIRAVFEEEPDAAGHRQFTVTTSFGTHFLAGTRWDADGDTLTVYDGHAKVAEFRYYQAVVDCQAVPARSDTQATVTGMLYEARDLITDLLDTLVCASVDTGRFADRARVLGAVVPGDDDPDDDDLTEAGE